MHPESDNPLLLRLILPVNVNLVNSYQLVQILNHIATRIKSLGVRKIIRQNHVI